MTSPPDVSLILASTSPRRRQLITLFGLPFQTLTIDTDETPLPDESPAEMVERLALAKAHAGQVLYPEALVVAADTAVAVDSQWLGKPADARDATRMLRLLRGRAHVVYSGLAIAEGERIRLRVVTTRVIMRAYSDDEIAAYIATGDPFDKAAAYGAQHPLFKPVAAVRGCFANVMGLPLCVLASQLEEFGHRVAPLECFAHPEHACAVPSVLGLDSQIITEE